MDKSHNPPTKSNYAYLIQQKGTATSHSSASGLGTKARTTVGNYITGIRQKIKGLHFPIKNTILQNFKSHSRAEEIFTTARNSEQSSSSLWYHILHKAQPSSNSILQ